MARSATIRCKSSSRLGELTALTRLDLDGCSVPDDLSALSALTGLQHLAVSVMTHDPAGGWVVHVWGCRPVICALMCQCEACDRGRQAEIRGQKGNTTITSVCVVTGDSSMSDAGGSSGKCWQAGSCAVKAHGGLRTRLHHAMTSSSYGCQQLAAVHA
jgi:hypothetical protein